MKGLETVLAWRVAEYKTAFAERTLGTGRVFVAGLPDFLSGDNAALCVSDGYDHQKSAVCGI